MRLASVRSGLAETFDDVVAVAVDTEGTIVASSGDIAMPFYYRSAIKPIQAFAAISTGLDLPPEHLALASSSHGGYPVHIAIVRAMLADAGLDESALRTTPGRPRSRRADTALIERGDHTRRPILHNCSGKHAGWLAACVTAGWDTDTYLDPDHPLQRAIVDAVTAYTGLDPRPVGVDGCGAPTLRGDVCGLARAFAALDAAEELRSIRDAVAAYPALVAENRDDDGRVGAVWGGPQKGGAAGSFAMARAGIGIASKSVSGDSTNAILGALVLADRLGMITEGMRSALDRQFAPPVFGAGRVVGHVEVVAE
ncbi:MAG: asparaginase [Acidimicrobiia bacterium]|nr:asparaginase [Acidimicrobiia bacterium]